MIFVATIVETRYVTCRYTIEADSLNDATKMCETGEVLYQMDIRSTIGDRKIEVVTEEGR